jgi:glucosamine--fructose-6-phosphate aminotransferase (isomerizing)
MCGIIGYTGGEQAGPLLLDGLARLEYRGYDSSGLAIWDGERIDVRKAAGKLGALRAQFAEAPLSGETGMGHTRWATHGRVNDVNAHPHRDCRGNVHVIHNGIVENFVDLRARLRAGGHHFVSDTDTEVIPHLIEEHLRAGSDLLTALRLAAAELHGAHAIVAMAESEPGVLAATRLGNAGGVVVGFGEDAMLLASDLPALLPLTRRVSFLYDREFVRLTRDTAFFVDATGTPLVKEVTSVPFDEIAARKGQYKHFMLKEMYEQPEALTNTIRPKVTLDPPAVHLPDVGLTPAQARALNRVVLIGMGSSMHALMISRPFFEQFAGLPAEFDNASEFRYRNAPLDGRTLVVSMSQSGETVDTLEAMAAARRAGALQVTICNVPGAQSTRVADGTVYINAGPEVAVASTKCYTAAVAALYLLACWLGRERGTLDDTRLGALLADIARLPQLTGETLARTEPVEHLARKLREIHSALFLGRGAQYPVAMEGALKMKEISYIHAEGYPAGEMKHGPIALIDREMPVIALAPRDALYEKIISNIEQVHAREGYVLAVGTDGDEGLPERADDVLWVPEAPETLLPVLTSIPLQLLAYHIAVWRGCDVDQPRNLAKTVTVE